MANSKHRWKFYRAGGVDQVTLRNGADLLHLEELNQKLWVALAMPTRGVEFDPKTLDMLDTDKDGRVRAPEIIGAVKWCNEVFTNLDDLFKGGDSVPLPTLKEGPVRSGAKRILENLGKGEATSISLADVADTAKIFAATKFNGDGVVPADSAEDESTRKAIEDIIATVGGVPDRSGKPGVDLAKTDLFFSEATAFSNWKGQGEDSAAILPLNEQTASAAAAVNAVRAKVDDYFARCRLAAFDGRALGAVNRQETEFLAVTAKDLSFNGQEFAGFPLARVEAGKALPLIGGLNPAWADAVAALEKAAVAPLLGGAKTSLTEAEWVSLKGKLAPFENWMAGKPASTVEKLGVNRVREILKSKAREAIAGLIQKDAALAEENAQISAVEKALRLQRDFVKLLNNYVNFSDFYSRKGAIFQAGTLYLDSRSCSLCIQVLDAGKHASMAGLSAAYLAYCDCTRSNGEKMTIVAGFTDGDSDYLMVGRNGIFYDRKGRDWDATITRIVANPISIRQAFWLPYKKFVRMIEEQIAKRAAAAEAESQARMAGAATAVANADKTKADKPAEVKKVDVGTVAAISVAIAGLGAMVTGILTAFFGLGAWMPIGIIAILMMISGPSMLLAYLKLRQRNLGPILDANGWALNGRARINVPFGKALTGVPCLPEGTERSLQDPYAEKRNPWPVIILVLITAGAGWLLWNNGKLDKALPEKWQRSPAPASSTNAPAAAAAASGAAPAATPEKK